MYWETRDSKYLCGGQLNQPTAQCTEKLHIETINVSKDPLSNPSERPLSLSSHFLPFLDRKITQKWQNNTKLLIGSVWCMENLFRLWIKKMAKLSKKTVFASLKNK